MSKVGVNYYAVSSTTMCCENYCQVLEEIRQLVDLDKKKVLPIMWITPEGLKGNIAWFLESEIKWKCLKIHPFLHPYRWDKKLLNEVIDIARELKVPIMIHTGDEDCCHAAIFEVYAKENPDTIIILAHGRPLNQSIYLLKTYENVFVDTAFMPIADMVKITKEDLSSKLLWGSDMCIPQHFFPNQSLELYYKSKLLQFRKSVSAEDYSLITFNNAQRLFHI